MADYIGKKPKSKGKDTIKFLFLLVAALIVGSLYIYFNYIWPQRVEHRVVDKLAIVEELINEGCKEDDANCQERLIKAKHDANINVFDQRLREALSTEEMKKHLSKAHIDGSICFYAGSNKHKAPSEEELVLWLGNYGSKKFLDDKPLFSRAREMYEARYHKPTPLFAQLKLLNKLRWRHIPFGETWRNYTLAARMMEWSSLIKGPSSSTEPTKEEKRVMKAIKKNPVYFTDNNIGKITSLAKRELTLERLGALRDAVKRFMRDVRELPLTEERTELILGWLASRDNIHPWLKRRWRGPYVGHEELADLWGCPIVGTRVPQTGAMTITAYGGDCAEGGEGEAEDIALSISTYTRRPRPKKKSDDQVVKKKPRKKKSDSIILP